MLRHHVQRHAPLQRDLVARGRLMQEITGGGGCAGGGDVRGDVQVAAWARGLVDKGSISFVPSFARARYPNMPCLYVGGEDVKTGLGVAYASKLSLSLSFPFPLSGNMLLSFTDMSFFLSIG